MSRYIFIDRDGVLNKDPGGWTPYSYVTRWEEFKFLPGVIEALRRLKTAGYTVFVISNQAGVSKGYFTQKDLDGVSRRMLAEIRKGKGDIGGLFYCTHSDGDNCPCRKPKTGLLEKAAKGRKIDWRNAYFIGDSARDVLTGKRMGMRTIFVLCGKDGLDRLEERQAKPDYIKRDLLDAVNMILLEEGK